MVVVATPRLEESRVRVDEGLESFIQQRDELYRKARASSKIQVQAGGLTIDISILQHIR